MPRALFIFAVYFLFAACVFGQTPVMTGYPPFGSFDVGGADAVDLANLNVNLPLPIVSTPGRMTGFSVSLSYDTLIWQNGGTGTAWTPVTDHVGNPIWGWKTIAPLGDILYKHTITRVQIRCSIDNFDWKTTETYNSYIYRDPAGTTHSFGAVFWKEITNGCTGSVTTTYQLTGSASDASGMQIDISSNLDIPNVWTKSGILLNTNAVDNNGNTVSKIVVNANETDWKDTAGIIASRIIQNGSTTEYHYNDASGADQYFALKRQLYSIKTAFGCAGITDYNTAGTMPQVSLPYEFDLPNGQKYLFTYEPTPNSSGFYTGRLRQVTLPTGGTIQYTYPATPNNGINCANGTAVSLSRTISDGTNSATWNYVRNVSALTTTVTTPQLSDTPNANDTVYTFNSNGQEISHKIYSNSPGTGTPLRTVNTTWATNSTPATKVTILEDGSTQSETDTNFDSNGILQSVAEYDFGSPTHGSLIRTTTFTYETATAYTNLKMFNIVKRKVITDGTGATQYRQDINYDETGYVNASCPAGAPQHDDTGYPCSFSTRGLPTSIISYANAAGASGALTQHLSYDWFGNVIAVTDPGNNTTSISYSDSFSDGINRNTNSLPTTITQPNTGTSHISHVSYFYNVGLPYQTTDENNQISSFSYDLMKRTASTTDPTNAQGTFSYGANSMESVLNFGTSTVDRLSTLDGFGRVQIRQTRQAPGGTSFDSVETDYDLTGRVRRVTAPYSGTAGQTASPTGPASTTSFDVLGRPTTVTDAGGGNAAYTYTLNDVLVTVGPAPSGENTKRRVLEYNALGRLTSVCEVTGTAGSGSCGQKNPQSGFLTRYTYDVLGNLTTVTQNAQPGGTQQARSYSSDGLSRLISETNPESGTKQYFYDTTPAMPGYNCQSTSSGDLVKSYDAAGNTICFAYDALHRLIQKFDAGPNSQGLSSYFVWDSATVNGTNMSNTKGRIAEAYTATCFTCTKLTDEGFGYTVRGEVSDFYESTPHSGGYYHLTQSYWANGVPNQLGNNITGLPAFTYVPDGEGRVTQVTASSGQNPVTGVTYNVASFPTQVTLGSGDSDSFTYDNNTFRMNQYKFTIGSTPQSQIGNLTWNQNGTLATLAITDPFNASDNQTCNLQRDDLARLGQVDCGAGAWGQAFSYDAFGNISKSVLANHTGFSFQPAYSATNNHLTNVPSTSQFVATYDANGNVTNDSIHTYSWNASGNALTVDGVAMTYDALDRTVEQNSSGVYTEVAYSPIGAKFLLMNGQTLKSAFVPLPGQAIAVYTSAGLHHYRHADWLGSARLISSPSRTVLSTVAYAPYGETYAASGSTDISFTGQNPDTVSTNYDFLFREYNTQGRWASPDPLGGSLVYPQSLNRYGYVMNDPCDLIDPLGLDSCKFKFSLANAGRLTPDQLKSAIAEINRILGAGNSGLSAVFMNIGKADFTATLKDYSFSLFSDAGVNSNTYGKNDQLIEGFGSLANSARVFVNNIQSNFPSMDLGIAVGRVITHEFGHFGLQVYDNNLNPGPGIMSTGDAPVSDSSKAFFDPKVSIPKLQELCRSLRKQGKKTSRGGGGGANGGDTYYPPYNSGGFTVDCYSIGPPENTQTFCTIGGGSGFGGGHARNTL